MKFTNCSTAALAIASVGLATTLSSPASACGGLFCNGATPVNQAAERIVFAVNDDNTVTAAIEILYEGPAESFAWILPVPEGEVTVAVSSKQALDSIDQQSNPIYQLNTTVDQDSCNDDDGFFNFGFSGGAGESANSVPLAAAVAAAPPSVQVVDSGNAGPYVWEQIMVNAEGEDPVEVALKWLTDNDYDVTEDTAERLLPYLEKDFNLVAFKLNKQGSQGSIRPVLLTYQGTQAMIPIQPTAVAANEDMGIKVWVLGDSRSVALNYANLELNEAAINWFNAGSNYNDVVIAAANEAGGHGFVTEQSGPAQEFAPNIYPEETALNWQGLQTGVFSSVEDFLNAAASRFRDLDGVNDVLSDPRLVPLREGATREQFLNCVTCYFDSDVAVRNNAFPETPYVQGEDPLDEFDTDAFLVEFERLVIQPLRDTQAMFENSNTSTRFYTTLSPDEMDMDPTFDFNDELGSLDNLHTAERTIFCTDNGNEWSITLPQGTVVSGQDSTWPLSEADVGTIPSNFRVLSMSTRGEGEVLTDNADTIQTALTDNGSGESEDEIEQRANGGCSVSGSGSGSTWWAIAAALGLIGWRRRTQI